MTNTRPSKLAICPVSTQNAQDIEPIIAIPGSKSHTIRALLLAGLAKGTSTIYNPLHAGDTLSCIKYLQEFDIQVNYSAQHSGLHAHPRAVISSLGLNAFKNTRIDKTINLGNSGTTLYFATALSTLNKHGITLNGDASLQTRSALPLLQALKALGAHIDMHAHGCVPYTVGGYLNSGEVSIECSTSQYLSALLLALSLVKGKSTIYAHLIGELAYVDMTIDWLSKHQKQIIHDATYNRFEILGDDTISPFEANIPGDFSSAAFFLGYTAITGHPLTLSGLQEDKTQGDMAILNILETMGCRFQWERDSTDQPIIKIQRIHTLQGGEFDLSETPDLLPILAVVASFARSPTRLYNVAHARKKETDRIAVVTKELSRLGVKVKETNDGLIITPSQSTPRLLSGEIYSHHDHRIAMAFAVGAAGAQGDIIIHDADVATVTFPSFFEMLHIAGVQTRLA